VRALAIHIVRPNPISCGPGRAWLLVGLHQLRVPRAVLGQQQLTGSCHASTTTTPLMGARLSRTGDGTATASATELDTSSRSAASATTQAETQSKTEISAYAQLPFSNQQQEGRAQLSTGERQLQQELPLKGGQPSERYLQALEREALRRAVPRGGWEDDRAKQLRYDLHWCLSRNDWWFTGGETCFVTRSAGWVPPIAVLKERFLRARTQ
jgi:hypothetical protein